MRNCDNQANGDRPTYEKSDRYNPYLLYPETPSFIRFIKRFRQNFIPDKEVQVSVLLNQDMNP
jgi:hypothetical protein